MLADMTHPGVTPAVPALLTAPLIVVVQRPKVMSLVAEYDLYAPDGTPYGSAHQRPGSGTGILGQLATISYDFMGVDGQLLMQMVKPGNIGRARFDVSWGNGQPIGTVEQHNLLFSPQFDLTTVDGSAGRLTGGAMMSWEWQIEVGAESLGAVTKQFAGLAEFFTSADKFVVQLAPALTGGLRALAIASTVCLDEVRAARRRG